LLQIKNTKKNTKNIVSFIMIDLVKNKYIYLMLLPVVAYYTVFCYIPIYGAQIAFKDYSPGLGIWGSPWVGLKHYLAFFTGPYFARTLRNTILISLYSIIFSFPAPIILALSLNEVRVKSFKRIVQTISYLPHFISMVVICGLIREFTNSEGLISVIIQALGGEAKTMLLYPNMFRSIYIISGIWQGIGWGAIIYMAALTGIDPNLYDAAYVDGANRLRRVLHITIPGIAPTIIIMFILRVGSIMNVGFEKIILLYNSNIYETADVISSFVYRAGLLERRYSYSAAVGLFNSLVNFMFVYAANAISRKMNETSLW
jgi:putative aldouronate transport system permease protein